MRATTKSDLSFQYFEFYVKAYFDDVDLTVMSLGAEACYFRLCARQWQLAIAGKLLPLEAIALQRLTKATPAEWRSIWVELEPLFPIAPDGTGRRNPALHEKWEERVRHVLLKRGVGKTGGRLPKDPAARAVAELHRAALKQELLANRLVKQMANHDQNQAANHDQNHEQNHKEEQSETTEKPYGFAEVNHTPNHNPNHNETLELVVRTQSPPPSGGGSFPAPPPGEGFAHAPGTAHDPGPAAGFAAQLASAVAPIPDDGARAAAARLLTEQRIPPLRWGRWVERFGQWTEGIGTPERRALSWDGIAIGIVELLDVNPEGQRITPESAVKFADTATRRLEEARLPASADDVPDAPVDDGDSFLQLAKRQAAAGDPGFQAHCAVHGITYTTGAA